VIAKTGHAIYSEGLAIHSHDLTKGFREIGGNLASAAWSIVLLMVVLAVYDRRPGIGTAISGPSRPR